jgi:hypothetical protein
VVYQGNRLMHQKNKSSIYLIMFIGFFLHPASPVNASQGSLEYCQKVNDKIRYYTSLRKLGESAKKMENWKTQRRKHKKKFIERNCNHWKEKLKE